MTDKGFSKWLLGLKSKMEVSNGGPITSSFHKRVANRSRIYLGYCSYARVFMFLYQQAAKQTRRRRSRLSYGYGSMSKMSVFFDSLKWLQDWWKRVLKGSRKHLD